MRPIARPVAMALVVLLAGCATTKVVAPRTFVTLPMAAAKPGTWRAVAADPDQESIDTLPERWDRALAAVPKYLKPKLDAEGPLVKPLAAQTLAMLPVGPYRCRLVRLGARPGYATYAPDICYVDGDAKRRSFTKQDGENLPGGWLFEDSDSREVFLGATRKNAKAVPPPYGDNPTTDVAGVVERVSPFRWRLVLPKAGRGAILDIYELIPLTPQAPVAPQSGQLRPRKRAAAG